ncbi:MAG: TAG lipase/steryl ester hydrolase/phospholipase A2/LPA acyltransferase [bacterium]
MVIKKSHLKNPKVKRCIRQMQHARDYTTWHDAALELDRLVGNNEWKATRESKFYDYEQILQRLNHIQNCRAKNDIGQLVYSLREGLLRNLGNLANPALYSKTFTGTKYLIDDYIDTVEDTLVYLCDNEFKSFPFHEKLSFFEETAQSFGRTALLLSGGATFGLFHLGVLKAFLDQDLLPQVLSGSSAGSMVSGLIGTSSNDEIYNFIENPKFFNENIWEMLSMREMLQQKAVMNNTLLEKFIKKHAGDYTFQEAYEKTGRIVNITVSPYLKNQMPRLLNYLTSPHLMLWSACLASSAVPGLFPPVMLTAKDRNGRSIPYKASVKWIDGSISHDLPLKRLSELYNVNHFIVSQTNPHVIPFMSHYKKKKGIGSIVSKLVKSEIQHRSSQMIDLVLDNVDSNFAYQVLNKFHGIMNQQYHGDITIHPPFEIKYYSKVISNLTHKEVSQFVLLGERATWPKISMAQDQTRIGIILNQCLERLKIKRSKLAQEFGDDFDKKENIG